MERHDTPEPPADDVRHRPAPPIAGPNVKNLLIATALVLAALGATIAFLPSSGGGKAAERPAPPPPDSTFLQQPPPREPPAAPARPPWWDTVTVRPEPAPEPPDETYVADESWHEPLPPTPPPPPPDPRQAAFTKALKSSSLRRVGVDPPAHLRGASASPAAPSPAAQLAALPGEMQATLAALKEPAAALARAGGQSAAITLAPAARAEERSPAQLLRTVQLPSLYVRAGTLIPARLEAGIDSDAPGPVTARVLRDVVESTGGQRVVIPAGAQLLGTVGNQLTVGEDRVLVAFDRVAFGGVTFELPGFEALEEEGGKGLAGRVDRHTLATLGRAVLLAAVGAGFELSQPDRSNRDALTSGEIVASEVALNLHRVATQILSRGLDRRPTVKIPAGERFVVYLHRDLVL